MNTIKVDCSTVKTPMEVKIGGKDYSVKAIPVEWIRDSATLPDKMTAAALYDHRVDALAKLLKAEKKDVKNWDGREVNFLYDAITSALNPDGKGGEPINPPG